MKLDADLTRYEAPEIEHTASSYRQIDPASVVIAEWVPLKCQFGCGGFNMSYACPPHAPSPAKTQAVVNGFRRALLYQFTIPQLTPDNRDAYLKLYRKIHRAMVDVESTLFKDGYHKAFVFQFGGCMICDDCTAPEGKPCRFRHLLRPCMESSGMDVFETVRANGIDLETLKVRGETRNQFCLMLVD
jgi:predicted metal-binding protein